MTAIEVEGVVKHFGAVRALDGVDFAVAAGTVSGLLGPNGAGKTTAIRILSTLITPDGGRATVGGYDVVRQAVEVRRLIGLTGQYAAVDEFLSGRENLSMIGRLLGMTRKPARERADELLAAFDLVDVSAKIVKTYSGGMRRRLDLGASLVGHPQFLYLDEPTTGLDPRSRLQLWDLIRRLVADGTTVLLTTQYLEEADRLADEIVVVDQGRVIASGTADQLKSRVGRQVLELRPADPSQLPLAADILERLGAACAVHGDGDALTAALADRSVLSAVVVGLDRAGVVVDDLTLRRPTLDEVFLALTGHQAEPLDEPGEPDETLERRPA